MWVRILPSLVPVLALAGCAELPLDDSGAAGPCATSTLAVTAIQLPGSGSEAAALGFDLDGDRSIDNQLGKLSAALSALYDAWTPEDWVNQRLAAGEVQWLAQIDRCEGEPGWAARLGRGVDTDDDGRPDQIEDDAPATGAGGVVRDGIGRIPVGLLADGGGVAADAAWEDGFALAVAARAGAGGEMTLTVGATVALGDAALAPAAAFLTAELARGSRFAAGVDTDRDRVVSVAELRASPAVASLLAPDLAGALSIGFELTARPIRLDDAP